MPQAAGQRRGDETAIRTTGEPSYLQSLSIDQGNGRCGSTLRSYDDPVCQYPDSDLPWLSRPGCCRWRIAVDGVGLPAHVERQVWPARRKRDRAPAAPARGFRAPDGVWKTKDSVRGGANPLAWSPPHVRRWFGSRRDAEERETQRVLWSYGLT